ncbi:MULTISPECIES: helix-turn-helix transcriptional regulator [unclassified Streptomyces]|uniref:helix-turn-helix domain-containing protein n=1 Tax=unclassified Streptomyces TaxID=2593676 RepID=UPI00136844BC|nr:MULTISPECIES: helix-turn-helix transcriptional regulator [unclassified Streptomyces]NEA05224.1 helix-turn-helix transcriptional regulator [Streptomyces sp. SID10116]MYY82486.1 helix-turn-helix domain-containing protein [Streptomyces sp. SID335]MYZ19268.1 helix-turn-helix domain-containing protein [Streptomyces sp. SID337]NDZ87979.1 helix-turn-helix transcriptional regulator [Streptomyces sp. SID10115]NEB45403.1 helix-turn-helix transcriptional regulator [Streptomyces sp. SID339]
MSDQSLGANLKAARKMRGLSVNQLAELVSVSPSYVKKIESGSRRSNSRLSLAFARALMVGEEVLTGQPYYGDPEAEDRVHAIVPDLRRLLLTYDSPEELVVSPRALIVLGSEVDQIAALRRDAKYAPMGPLIPPVITELTHLALDARSEQETRRAYWHLARAYRAVNSLAHKLGHHDLSNTALERVRWAADRSGDPLMQVTAGYLIAGALIRTGAFPAARRMLEGLRSELERQMPEHSYTADGLAVDGALVLKLAVVESRCNNQARVRDYLEEAKRIAHVAGGVDSLAYEMSFGPTNIKIHEVHALIEACDTEQALARLDEWGSDSGPWVPPQSTVGERFTHHLIDTAHARLVEGDARAAFGDLKAARQIAANHVRFHPQARGTTTALLRNSRFPSEELTQYAAWQGVTTH